MRSLPYGEVVLDWDHNAYYQRVLLRHVPPGCGRVLDIGCGAGQFAARLAQLSVQVDAVDRSQRMIAAARRRAGRFSCRLVTTTPSCRSQRCTICRSTSFFLAWPTLCAPEGSSLRSLCLDRTCGTSGGSSLPQRSDIVYWASAFSLRGFWVSARGLRRSPTTVGCPL